MVSPVFKQIAKNHDRTMLTWPEEVARGTIALLGAGLVEKACGKSHIFKDIIFLTFLNALFALDKTRRDVDQANFFGILV